MGIILIVILVLLLVGTLPTWGHSESRGPYPSGGIGLVLVDRNRPAAAGADLKRPRQGLSHLLARDPQLDF